MKRLNSFFKAFNRSCFLFLSLTPIAIILAVLAFASCRTIKTEATPTKKVEMSSNNDSTEYSLIVFDTGYESYLLSRPSANLHSQQYYEHWNERYVREWNMRRRAPSQYGSFYDTEIYYDTKEDYGLELNYRLYYYFQFIKDEYGIVLIGAERER